MRNAEFGVRSEDERPVFRSELRAPNSALIHSRLLTTFGLSPPSSGCSSSASTTRKPITSMRVSHQMLWGSCGSHFIQLLSETRRVALRHRSAFSAHDPPRTTCDHLSAGGTLTRRRLRLFAARFSVGLPV